MMLILLVRLLLLVPDDEITLLARKFCALHKFRKERRRSPRGCFKCGDTTHFIADYPKRKKLDSSNKYDYTNQNNYSKGDNKKKLDSTSLEDDEKVKHKQGDFTGLCLMGKSLRSIPDSDSDVSDDLSFESHRA
jgi:hypothetical protein